MRTIRSLIATAAGITFTGMSLWGTAGTLDSMLQVDQPAQPSPKNPQPQPSNPSPRPRNPAPRPSNPQPEPRNPQPGQRNPVPDQSTPGAPNTQPAPREEGGDTANVRPFAFQSPAMEGRFNLATRRLVQMEARLNQSRAELVRQLGQARQLSGERQIDALFSVVQQMLKDQEDLQRYLVQSRTAWSGDVDLGAQDATPGEQTAPPPTPGNR